MAVALVNVTPLVVGVMAGLLPFQSNGPPSGFDDVRSRLYAVFARNVNGVEGRKVIVLVPLGMLEGVVNVSTTMLELFRISSNGAFDAGAARVRRTIASPRFMGELPTVKFTCAVNVLLMFACAPSLF